MRLQLGWHSKVFADLVLFVMALAAVSNAVALAQSNSPRQSSSLAIHGTVLDSAGKPVGNATVRLAQGGSSEAVTTTNPLGDFVFTSLRNGTYQISAEKSGLRSRVLIATFPRTYQTPVELVLEASNAGHSTSSAAASAEGMTFADSPNFTIAGITDWTAAGGHGSDVSLRTSEALAHDTTTLKPESPGVAGSGSAGVASASEAQLRAALAANPTNFDANHQLGEFCLQKGSYREAISPLETAYKIDPANRGNEHDLARAYKEAGDFAQAREHIQQLLKHEDSADLHRLLGNVDEQMGDSVAAEHEYEQAVRLDPSEQNYFTWGSELLLHRAVWPAAEVFRKGAEAHPKSARMLAALGAALFAGALYDEAAQRLCDASDFDPADPAPYAFLSKVDMVAPSPAACVEPKLKRFAQQRPGDARANYYYAMAIWKRQKASEYQQEVQQVEGLLTKAVAADPKYGEAYLQLGNLYFGEREFENAVGSYTKAIEADPQLSEAHYRLGVAYERTGEPAKAKQQFELHDEIEKQQAEAVEQQRRDIKQFLVVLNDQPTPSHR